MKGLMKTWNEWERSHCCELGTFELSQNYCSKTISHLCCPGGRNTSCSTVQQYWRHVFTTTQVCEMRERKTLDVFHLDLNYSQTLKSFLLVRLIWTIAWKDSQLYHQILSDSRLWFSILVAMKMTLAKAVYLQQLSCRVRKTVLIFFSIF